MGEIIFFVPVATFYIYLSVVVGLSDIWLPYAFFYLRMYDK